jgi:nucleotide-binding universal stress UspA family protein
MPAPRPVVTFARAVLGLNGGPTDLPVVQFACELARPLKAELFAVHVIEVDWTRDLSESLPGSRERASAILDLAEAEAERNHVNLRTQLLQARDIGAAIVDEAAELAADLIILGLPYRKKLGGDFHFGQVVPYVLENSPVEVWVLREPMPAQPAVAGSRSRAAARR